MTPVRYPETAGRRLNKVKRVSVSVREHEVGPEHQRPVRATLDLHVFAKALTQETSQCVRIKNHSNLG